MKITLKNTDKFRFTEKGHLHEMLTESGWVAVPGCSSISGCFDEKNWYGWWASGQALAPLGWVKPEKDGSNKEKILEAASTGFFNVQKEFYSEQSGLETIAYAKFLDKCYRAHAKETKDTASAGTDLHLLLSNYVKGKIDGNSLLSPESTLMGKVEEKFRDPMLMFMKWEHDNSVEWVASELQCGSLTFQFCGIADYVARINGKIVLGDFKTSKMIKTQAVQQLTGLRQCIQEMGQKIDQIAVTRLSREGDFEHKVFEVNHDVELLAFLKAKEFYQARNLFKVRHKENQ